MSDDLERRLRDFPSELPRPGEEATSRAAAEVLGASRPKKRRGAISLGAALLAALAVGAALGSVTSSASSSTVTVGVRPSIVGFSGKPEIFGAVTSAKAGEEVTVQFKQCGLYPTQFRDFMTTTTIDGGAWSLGELLQVRLQIYSSGSFRAVWGDEMSREVALKMRAGVYLLHRGDRFWVQVTGTQSFWHRRVRVERFDPGSRRWILVRSLLLTESDGSRDWGQPILINASEPFRPAVPKGTTLRAVLSREAAKPCYLGGPSRIQRT